MHCTDFLYGGVKKMRQENLDQRLRCFTVILVSLASCVLALCAAQGILGYPFRKTIGLDAAKFVPVEGFAYSAPLLPNIRPEVGNQCQPEYTKRTAFLLYTHNERPR